jgi:hypothetical protein
MTLLVSHTGIEHMVVEQRGDRAMKLYHSLAIAALLAVGPMGASFASHSTKPARSSTKTSTATMYECTHCNIKMTAKEAKAHKMTCACGAKLTAVKRPAKTSAAKKA